MSAAAPTILIVDDNDLDVENLERGFKRLNIDNPVVRAKDGLEGLDMLRNVDSATGLATPCVVLLDLNMPRMNGIEFLGEVRNDEAISDTPVFVLTTSNYHKDVQAAQSLNIDGYIIKSLDRDTMTEALSMIDMYWGGYLPASEEAIL